VHRPLRLQALLCGAAGSLVLVAGCGSSGTSSSRTVAPAAAASTTPPTSATAATTAPPTTASPAGVDLSGSWSGQYSGIYTGTFKLTWQQSGAVLNGTIDISAPADSLGIRGTVQGSSISFGAVGVVTYSGTVHGNSMSGTYQSQAPGGGGGSWSATKA
jgi:hypothetical protein